MSKIGSLYELESLFIEKLQEKYKLNIRDVKRAFSRFDLDNNGLLDLSEMVKGVQTFLNGVEESQVRELVARYDLNGDGKISYEEFLGFLSSRTAIDPDEGALSDRYGTPDTAELYLQRRGMGSRGGRSSSNGRPSHHQGAEVMRVDQNYACGDDDYAQYEDMSERYSEPPSSRGSARLPPRPPPGRFRREAPTGPPMPPEDFFLDKQQGRPSSASSTASSNVPGQDPSQPETLAYRAKLFLQQLRAHFVQKAATMRQAGKINLPVTMTLDDLHLHVAETLLRKLFQPHTGENDGRVGRRQNPVLGVEAADFVRTLRSIRFPGLSPLRPETAQYLFTLCSHTAEGDVIRNETGEPMADVNALISLLFGRNRYSHLHGPHGGAGERDVVPLDKTAVSVDRDGAVVRTSLSGTQKKNKSFVESLDQGRSAVGIIPQRNAPTTDGGMQNPVHAAQAAAERSQLDEYLGGKPTNANAAGAIPLVPLRFLSRKARTALTVPAHFQAHAQEYLQRSNSVPGVTLRRAHVFGLSTTRYSGPTFYVLRSGGGGSGRPRSAGGLDDGSAGSDRGFGAAPVLDTATILYSSAAVGVIHDLQSHRQVFAPYVHRDDIICVALSPDGNLAATGCVGKNAVVALWHVPKPGSTVGSYGDAYEDSYGQVNKAGGMGAERVPTKPTVYASQGFITEIGLGFFARGVNAVSFSYDSQFLVAIGCDDNHILGVFAVPSGQLVTEMSAQHGVPPQITWMSYAAGPAFCADYISREQPGQCDLFATTGSHHLRLWSFSREALGATGKSATPVLAFKSLTIPSGNSGKKGAATTAVQTQVVAPKVYTSVVFLSRVDESQAEQYDVIAGGSNGAVYLFRKGKFLSAQMCFPGAQGRVQCLTVHRDKVYVGGSGASVFILDGRTLQIMKHCALLGTAVAVAKPLQQRPRSAQDVQRAAAQAKRAASAGRFRTASAGLGTPRSGAVAAGKATNSGAGEGVFPEPVDEAAAQDAEAVLQESGSKVVTGLQVVVPPSAAQSVGAARAAGLSHIYLLATLGTGKLVRVDLDHVDAVSAPGRPQSAGRPSSRPGSSNGGGLISPVNCRISELFAFHIGAVYALAVGSLRSRDGPSASLGISAAIATAGDDKKVCLWDHVSRRLLAQATGSGACRTIALDQQLQCIATGSTVGEVTLYVIEDRRGRGPLAKRGAGRETDSGLHYGQYRYRLSAVTSRKDSGQELTCMAFAPNNALLAVGSRDDSVYVYTVHWSGDEARGLTPRLQALHRLRGHSSTITHLDWSYDSRLLRTTCAAYELLCWDVSPAAGKLYTAVAVADVQWHTQHCILGVDRMGIWPPYSDGTDINAVDVSPDKAFIVTANDQDGLIRLLNYPSLVQHAPGRAMRGHSSHVTSTRFLKSRSGLGDQVVSTGGNDGSVMLFDVVPVAPKRDAAFR